MAPSARGSHAWKSPLDDTTYEDFSVICTPELALTAQEESHSRVPSRTAASLSLSHVPLCWSLICRGSRGDRHGRLAGGARAWSRASARDHHSSHEDVVQG